MEIKGRRDILRTSGLERNFERTIGVGGGKTFERNLAGAFQRSPGVQHCLSGRHSAAKEAAAACRALCPLYLMSIDPHYTNGATWHAC